MLSTASNPASRNGRGTFCLILAALLVCTLSILVEADVVNFPDPGLESAIRDAIGKPTGDIYDTDLAGLTYLNASARSIVNLEGVQYCSDLMYLWLPTNQIVDSSALSDLTNLTNINLGSSQIADISVLSGLTILTRLSLRGPKNLGIQVFSSHAPEDNNSDRRCIRTPEAPLSVASRSSLLDGR